MQEFAVRESKNDGRNVKQLSGTQQENVLGR
jgi:hypothetical protein